MSTTDELAAELGFDLGEASTTAHNKNSSSNGGRLGGGQNNIPPTTKKVSNGFDSSDDEEEGGAPPPIPVTGTWQQQAPKSNDGKPVELTKKAGNNNKFDDSDDDDGAVPALNSRPKTAPGKGGSKKASNWDDSSDEEGDSPSAAPPASSAGGPTSRLSTVKFPSIPENVQLIQQCTRECTLTCLPRGPMPCPYIRCEQCGYLVVRCGQAAEWHDDEGTKDLYLEMRYFYPDWSKYQPSTISPAPTGVKAAAYGCQCTWFTVYDDESFSIKTPIGASRFNVQGSETSQGGGKFISSSRQFRKEGGGGKPLPRWICAGHPPLRL